MLKNEPFFVGIDAGSDSVGWAATDADYKLLRLKGKTAWGARIFPTALDAKARRTFRTNGRRLARRKYRLLLLQGIFQEEINKVDNTLFLRMAQSSFCCEDRSENARFKCPLFKEKELEKSFYKKYPTIWHLRAALLNNDEHAFSDIRYVYLAIHHIMKYRGNFLINGDINYCKTDSSIYSNFDDINLIIKQLIAEDSDSSVDETDFQLFNDESKNQILGILLNKELYKKTKKKQISDLIAKPDKNSIAAKYAELIVALVTGGSFASTKIFPNDDKITLEFNSSFDDNLGPIQQLFGDYYVLIEKTKAIFDYVFVKNLLGNNPNLSSSFEAIYEDHKKQLRMLKDVLIDIDRNKGSKDKNREYYKMFHCHGAVEKEGGEENAPGSPKVLDNYSALVNVDSNTKKRISPHDFGCYVKKVLEANEQYISASNQAKVTEILNLIENDSFMLSVANVSNGTIPHQLHLNELKIILQHASLHFPFIKEVSDKIKDLFLFRVPYYYGPMDTRSPYSNVVLKDTAHGPITPWNYKNQIDDDKTREKFMHSLTNKCTYLFAEDVLPFDSIIYSDYIILDKLNKLQINGTPIEQSVKNELFKYVSGRSKTTINQISKFLVGKCDVYKEDGANISGINPDGFFTSNVRSCIQNSKTFDLENKDQLRIVEDIILILTIYTDKKSDAVEVIKKKYKLNNSQVKVINSLKCSGWGKYSHKLLDGLRTVDGNGVVGEGTISDILENTTQNFQQVLFNEKYGFKKLVDDENRKTIGNKTKQEMIDELIENTPPLMHRSIIQTLRIIDEITSITKRAPAKIAIEVTRRNETDKNKMKVPVSRRDSLRKFYKSLEKDLDVYKESINYAKEELATVELAKLKSKHMYLWFKQLGLDMYTGEQIKLEEILNGNKYDIDHIVPQSLIKNDSLDNIVLTKKEFNEQEKKDIYPLPTRIRNNAKVVELWKYLKKHEQISAEKYNALIRSSPISEGELTDFVNRQINIVDASNIVIRNILNIAYPKTKVIFSKAAYPSFIRKTYSIPKIRELNDTHHAVDAYLNIVAGTILDDTYGNIAVIKTRVEAEENQTVDKKTSFNMEHTIVRCLSKNDLANKIKSACNCHDFLLTYRNSYQDDAFYKMTINRKSDSSALIPIHSDASSPFTDTSKYGGYIGLIPEYMVIAKAIKGNKQTKIIVSVPRILTASLKDEEAIKTKLIHDLSGEYSSVEIDMSRKIYPNQKVLINGCQYLLCTKSAMCINLKPVTPIFVTNTSYLSLIMKNIEKTKGLSENDNQLKLYFDKCSTNEIIISKERNKDLYNEILKQTELKKYDICPMITDLRDCNKDDNIAVFMAKSIYQQIKIIVDTIQILGRNTCTYKTIKKDAFIVSKTKILNSFDVIPIYESVTGLFKSRNVAKY